MTQEKTPGEITLTREQLDFISFLKSNPNLTAEQNDKLEKLIAQISTEQHSNEHTNSQLKGKHETAHFYEKRRAHTPGKTADFLFLFTIPAGLKFLTHDFDPDSGMTMRSLLLQVDEIWKNRKQYDLPPSLYSLMSNFLYGPEWIDYNGNKHTIYLTSPQIQSWCHQNIGTHPISSNEYGAEIQAFRNTVRLSKPRLTELVSSIVSTSNDLGALSIHASGLDKADFYTNVYRLRQIIHCVLKDIAQRESQAKVNLTYERASLHQYRLCRIRITHEDSEANEFNEVQSKLEIAGGAMSNLLSYCKGYCDWAIEAKFEDGCKRWSILDSVRSQLDSVQSQDVEILAEAQVHGFSHIFTFFKKTSL